MFLIQKPRPQTFIMNSLVFVTITERCQYNHIIAQLCVWVGWCYRTTATCSVPLGNA